MSVIYPFEHTSNALSEVILDLNIPEDSLDVDRREQYLAKEMERFRKQVFSKVLQQLEDKALEGAKGRASCREKVPRYLFTRLGLIGFERNKVKYKEEARISFLLDDVLGVNPY